MVSGTQRGQEEFALVRCAKHIDVTVTGSVAHLKGTATSWTQREAAERAAYDAPGITLVDNQIVVDPPNDDSCEIC